MEDEALKQCPFCKERIRVEAIKCRYCGEWLERQGPIKPTPCESVAEAPPVIETHASESTSASKAAHPQQKPKKAIPVKTLYGVSAALLLGSTILLIIAVPWGKLTPEQMGRLTGLLMKVLVVAGFACWFEKRKGYKLLWFSTVCASFTVLGAYGFRVGANESQQAEKQLANGLSELYTNIIEGSTNGSPEMKPTGDRNYDMVLRHAREFSRGMASIIGGMNGKLEEIGERSVFEDSVLTNKLALETEVRKRVEAKRVIDSTRQDLPKTLEWLKSRITVHQSSSDDERHFIEGLEKSIRNSEPEWQKMFELLQKKEQAELDFLNLMAARDGAYELTGQRYDELSNAVVDAANAIDDFRSSHAQKAKAQLEQLGK